MREREREIEKEREGGGERQKDRQRGKCGREQAVIKHLTDDDERDTGSVPVACSDDSNINNRRQFSKSLTNNVDKPFELTGTTSIFH